LRSKEAIRKRKARRLTYNISVVAGFLGIFLITKGIIDMHRQIHRYVYFDRIIEARTDTLIHDPQGNAYLLRRGGTLKYHSRHPETLVLDGEMEFEVNKPVQILALDTIRIHSGRGKIISGRFPELWLREGSINMNGRDWEGKNLYWDGRNMHFEADSSSFSPTP